MTHSMRKNSKDKFTYLIDKVIESLLTLFFDIVRKSYYLYLL